MDVERSEKIKITLEQIADLAESTYTLADVRDEISFRYGTIPRAAHAGRAAAGRERRTG